MVVCVIGVHFDAASYFIVQVCDATDAGLCFAAGYQKIKNPAVQSKAEYGLSKNFPALANYNRAFLLPA